MSRRIVVVTTGGTIEAIGHGPDDLSTYMTTGRTVAPETLVPDLAGVEATHHRFGGIPSPSVTSRDWRRLLAEVERLAVGADGIVITHGTNTLEETALFLALTWPHPVPLVLTGAMRPASARSSDGPGNLVDALRVAASSAAAGRGALVVFAGRVHEASSVTKDRADHLDAFASPGRGPVGIVADDGSIRFGHPGRPRPAPVRLASDAALPRVEVVVSHADADGVSVDAVVAAGARGIVVAGTGNGFPTQSQHEALDRAHANGVTIVRASRCGEAMTRPHPSFPGWLAGGGLRAWQARTVVAVGLAAGQDADRLQATIDDLRWFAAGGPDR